MVHSAGKGGCGNVARAVDLACGKEILKRSLPGPGGLDGGQDVCEIKVGSGRIDRAWGSEPAIVCQCDGGGIYEGRALAGGGLFEGVRTDREPNKDAAFAR